MDESPVGTAEPTPEQQKAAAPPKPKGQKLKRIFVGGVVAFGAVSILYGPGSAMQMVALAVICTVGIGLIPILFVCWLVGWIVLEIWGSIAARRGATAST